MRNSEKLSEKNKDLCKNYFAEFFLSLTFVASIKNQRTNMNIPFYMNRRAYRVAVPRGTQRKLAEEFHVDKSFVSRVLRHAKAGRKAKEIETRAMEYGGWLEKVEK